MSLFYTRAVYMPRLVYFFILCSVFKVNVIESKTFLKYENEWTITFFTGFEVWSGTDSAVNIQIYGNLGKSKIIQIIPERSDMESRSIDKFSLGVLNQADFGNIQSITITKQHSYAFFNDWELLKIELAEPSGKIYLFDCNCWLTTLKYKRNIELSSINDAKIKPTKDSQENNSPHKNLRIFPVTVTLLFLFLILMIFAYFGKMMFQNWKVHSDRFSDDLTRSERRNSGTNIRMIFRSATLNDRLNTGNNSDKSDDEDDSIGETLNHRNTIYDFTQDLNDINISQNLSRIDVSNVPRLSRITANSIIEDNPPNYKELFPK